MVIPFPEEVPPEIPGWPGAEPYSVLEYRLDEARTEEEVLYPGDNITAATNGTLAGISVKFNSKRNQAIPLDQFNPISYPGGFEKFYLTNTAQAAGKKLYIFIGRAAGAGIAPTYTFTASQIAKVSGEPVYMYGYDYMSGEYRLPYVDASGELKIAVTMPDIVTAKISGETVVIGKYMPIAPTLGSGDVSIVRADVTGRLIAAVSGEGVPIYGYDYMSGEYRLPYVDASGELKISVTVADIVTAKISGQVVKISGEVVKVSGEVAKVSGETVIAKVSGETVIVASGAYVQVSGQTVVAASGIHVLISGQQVIAKVSGEAVRMYGYDYMSGEYRLPYVDASGELKISVTVADIVTAKISGQVVKVSGETVAVASGAFVQVSGQMIAVASGAFVLISGQQVIAKVSGETVAVASGAFVQVSGQTVVAASGTHVLISGQQVIAKVSGEAVRMYGYDYMSGEYRLPYVDASGELKISVTVADIVTAKISGQVVKISGETVAVASGAFVQVSGQMIAVASGAFVQVSGQMIAVASGAFVLISGQQVIAKVSGETVDIRTPTAVKTGAILTPTASSGGTIATSGAVKAATFKSLSGTIFVGGTAVGDMPYANYGFVLAESEAVSLDIDNFGRIRLCAVTSGSWVSKIGVS